MITFLDLLILVALALLAAGVVTMALMFLVKNRKVQKVSLYLTGALAVYLGYVGLRISWPMFMGQAVVAIVAALAGIAAVVLERLSKDNEKQFLLARVLSAAAVVVGIVNALFV